jgi:hypothetical protein
VTDMFSSNFSGASSPNENANRQELGLLTKGLITVAVLLILAGVVWHGITLTNLLRIWRNVADRPSAKLSFRFMLQPSMAAIAALRSGLNDARRGRSPFLQAILREPDERMVRLREGLNATARIMLLGIAVDVIYQLLEFQHFYPVESVVIALLLAFVPYCLIRGAVVRITRAAALSRQPH